MHPLLALGVLALSSGAAPPEPSAWPQWRGPDRDGVVRAADPWPADLGPDTLKKVWAVENLGPSYSGPVVTADRVFTTETVDKKTEVVTAFDRATGKPVWKKRWDGSIAVPFFAAANGSWVRSTPAFADGRLYVAGIRDVLACLDAATGDVVWTVDFPAAYNSPAPTFGFVCSPLVGPDGVYVQAGACLAKLDKATGKVLWRALTDEGGMNGSAFSSPVFADLAGKRQLVVQTRTKLAGVDPTTGGVNWERTIPSFRGMNILTPQPFGDGVFTSTYGGTTQLVKVTPAGAAADGWSLKYEGNMSSPVVVNGHAYYLGKDQRLVCVELASGKLAWRSEKAFGKYWSLAANGDKILGLDQRGRLFLLKANPAELEVLAERKVADAETWAHLAVAGQDLVVRDLYGLTLYRWAAD